jgi:hypothetical protein
VPAKTIHREYIGQKRSPSPVTAGDVRGSAADGNGREDRDGPRLMLSAGAREIPTRTSASVADSYAGWKPTRKYFERQLL